MPTAFKFIKANVYQRRIRIKIIDYIPTTQFEKVRIMTDISVVFITRFNNAGVHRLNLYVSTCCFFYIDAFRMETLVCTVLH